MVTGLYRRNPAAQGSTTPASSSLATTTAAGSLSLGWKFPLRGDSLSFTKSSKHHIVHADTKSGIDQLNDYLRNETELNAGKKAGPGDLGTKLPKPTLHQSLVADGQGLRSLQPVRGRPLNISNRSWHSLAQLGGERTPKHSRQTSANGRRDKVFGLFAFSEMAEDTLADTSSGHLVMSPPHNRQLSGDQGRYDMQKFVSAGINQTEMLDTQSPPMDLEASPVFTDIVGKERSDTFECTDTSTIIDLYAESSIPEDFDDSPLLHDSAHGSRSMDGCSSEDVGDCNSKVDSAVSMERFTALSHKPDMGESPFIPLPKTPSTLKCACSDDGKDDNDSDDNQIIGDPSSSKDGEALVQEQTPTKNRSRMSMQQELRQKLVRCLQDDYTNCIQSQQLKATSMLHEAEERFRIQMEELKRETEQRLADQELKHKQDIESQAQEFQQHIKKLSTDVSELTAERDELHAMLEDHILTSSKFIEQKDAECSGLSREIGQLTLERQRLQSDLEEIRSDLQAMVAERGEIQERADLLAAENMRLDSANSNLGSDILVAEERNTKIREHAEETLLKANNEIQRLQQDIALVQQEMDILRTRTSKAETRARSLQIQLESTKQQNADLLALCEH
ncbi:hypothetical protein GGI15_004924 [Coemansia interrupta]|uniref:Transforming acidic coiled-coil-containing protein C-terminal domain-containing protein n=1 Tax=Coemansia interrupta TaxID=1126814 RepID=A0A9W8H6L3_9FUNG|nr:hypothetical protein GGI15_004924 [Coemansia interrupta]